jgi:hypothetical protein
LKTGRTTRNRGGRSHDSRAILDGSIDPVLGIRKLNDLRSVLETVEALEVFAGLESESDEFRRGPERENYGAALLEKLDIEAESFLVDCKAILEEACMEVIREFELNGKETSPE